MTPRAPIISLLFQFTFDNLRTKHIKYRRPVLRFNAPDGIGIYRGHVPALRIEVRFQYAHGYVCRMQKRGGFVEAVRRHHRDFFKNAPKPSMHIFKPAPHPVWVGVGGDVFDGGDEETQYGLIAKNQVTLRISVTTAHLH